MLSDCAVPTSQDPFGSIVGPHSTPPFFLVYHTVIFLPALLEFHTVCFADVHSPLLSPLRPYTLNSSFTEDNISLSLLDGVFGETDYIT